jgi:hypothetical protein
MNSATQRNTQLEPFIRPSRWRRGVCCWDGWSRSRLKHNRSPRSAPAWTGVEQGAELTVITINRILKRRGLISKWSSHAPALHGLTRLSVWLIEQGIRLYYGRVRHPQTQGKVDEPGILEALRRQPDIEFNFHFVFGSNAGFSRRLDPEISQFHGGLAGVAAVLEHDLHRNRFRLPVQTQIPV